MIGQYLSNTNESATVSISQNFSKLNEASSLSFQHPIFLLPYTTTVRPYVRPCDSSVRRVPIWGSSPSVKLRQAAGATPAGDELTMKNPEIGTSLI